MQELNSLRESRIKDFGQVRTGEVLEQIFVLRNTGNKPMTIMDMHTSCGCTVSEVENKYILPGEDTTVKVRFHTQGYSGKVEQYVYVHTDNENEPVVKFSISAEIVK